MLSANDGTARGEVTEKQSWRSTGIREDEGGSDLESRAHEQGRLQVRIPQKAQRVKVTEAKVSNEISFT